MRVGALGAWVVRAAAWAACVVIAGSCGSSETPPSAGGEATGGGGEQVTPSPPEVVADAGPGGQTEMDAAPEAAADAGPTAMAEPDTGVTIGDGGAAAGAMDDAGAGPSPEERWRAMVRRGRSRFGALCGTCHPGGNEDMGPRIRGVGFSVSRMRRQIRAGSGRMRPIPPGRLNEADLESLMAYLSTMGAVRGVQRPQ